MDIFCRNIPQAVSDKHMAKEFRPILERYGLNTFKCRKNGPKTAIITVIDKDKALTLLAIHGQQPGQKRRPPQPIKLFGQPIYLEPSRHAPENLLLRSLEQSEENRQTSLASKSIYGPEPPLTKDNRSLLVLGMSCGVWAYVRDVPVFYECYSWGFSGVLVFRQRSIKVDLNEKYSHDVFTIDFAYSNLYSIFTGHGKSSFTITTRAPPKLYHSSEEEQQKAREAKIKPRNVPSRSRVGHFPLDQEASAGCCYTYRFVLQNAKDMTLAKSLGRKFHAPEMYQWRDSVGHLAHSFQSHIKYFIERLRVETIPYRVKFQLQALIWNGYMSPLQAIGFLAHVKRILNTADEEIVARALGRLKNALVFPSPDVQGWEVQIQNVVGALSGIIKELNKEKNSGIAPQRIHPNMVNIHHVTVTPCAMFLAGPKQEAKNRVLRKYEGFTDYFLRVNFTDEDGGPVRFDFKANTDKIFHDRFKNILKQGIDIGGRHFNYLGFSHSSLRSQTCWFVAPFRASDGRTWSAETIINNLGIFTQIKSPSKMAARIGQTFSDTVASIEIPPESVVRMNDVERNGRCFSDGVGTISLSIARKIWRQYGSKAPKRPTVFQIRYAGAKGMVSLDSRLAGDQLCLRKSMIKFEATGSAIEICGSGIRALPFYLNQQLIKILEDLGVSPSAFMRLQRQEIDRLRSTPGSVAKAADFLEGTHIPRSINFPWLLRTLEKELQLSFRDDPFLRALVNLAILIRLRDLKYRARIPVSQAVTLYGVMDETGYLKENEVYCAMTGEDGRTQVLVRNEVVITRSPALHPGDIQIVNAVNVDIPNHPLTWHVQAPLCRSKRICLDIDPFEHAVAPCSLETDGRLDVALPPKDLRPAALPKKMSLIKLPSLCRLDSHEQRQDQYESHTPAADCLSLDPHRGRRSPAPSPEAGSTMPYLPALTSEGTLDSSNGTSGSQKGVFSPSSVSSKSTAPTSICSNDCSPKMYQKTSFMQETTTQKRKRSDDVHDVSPEWAPLQLKGITPEELRWTLATGKRVKADAPEHPKYSILRLPRQQPKSRFEKEP
ncbi:hypothetical protein KEM56_003119 [Ascosphaera pollenicola]|nr:hypothetical protein KEM56_003119 [Ascosphaera pollenicola]